MYSQIEEINTVEAVIHIKNYGKKRKSGKTCVRRNND